MSQDKKQQQASLKFLEYVGMVEDMKELNPYLKEALTINAGELRHRYTELIKAGFTPHDALEIVKARGVQL